MIHGVTGHRDVVQKPGELKQFARLSVARMVAAGATEIITGMAQGWDLAVAEACIEQNVLFCAAIPFPYQPGLWPLKDRNRWAAAVEKANRVHVVGHLSLNRFYKQRNCWIVDHCVHLWSLYLPDMGGGTKHCVLYAQEVGRTVTPLWDDWLQFRDERT